MKLRYLFTSIAAALVLAAGCQKVDEPISYDDFALSSSYVAISTEGGSTKVILTANDSWEITVPDDAAKWLTVTPTSGLAGDTEITFKAEGLPVGNNEAALVVTCGERTLRINVLQGIPTVQPASCKDVLNGVDGTTYRVTGTVTKIAETATYGNFYINDGTGEVYVYGTKYDGKTKQGALEKLGIEVGDILTIEGPRKDYNGTIELVDVDVVKVVKALLGIENEAISVEKDEAVITIKVAYKGNGVKVVPQADWMYITDIDVQKDTAYVSVHIAANEEDTRSGEIYLSSSIPGQTTEGIITVTQATGLSMYTLPYAENFSNGQGAFEVVVTTPRADGKDIWTAGSYSGTNYMKATAGSKGLTESMLVSPMISLKGVASPVLTFEHCGKYFGNQQQESTLWVSTDGCQTWSQLLIPEHDNAYGWKKSGDISLASIVGKEYFQIGFKYVSTANAYGTWEIAGIKIEDRAPVFNGIAELNNAAASAEVQYEVTLTDAVVTFVSGGNAFIQDATGGTQLYLSNHGLTAGKVINGKVTVKEKLYSGYAELTYIDLSAAKVTEGNPPTPTVLTLADLAVAYNRYLNCMVKVEGITFDKDTDGSAKTNVNMSSAGTTIAARTQEKTVVIDKSKTYDVICFPSKYNTPQIGIWSQSHLTAK